jgi:hypothetical protein
MQCTETVIGVLDNGTQNVVLSLDKRIGPVPAQDGLINPLEIACA